MTPFFRSVLLLAFLVTSLSAQNGDRRGEVQAPLSEAIKVPPAPVLTPAEELATFKLPAGFRAELIAGDPLIGDPVAMQFSPDGRLWVLEMRGYMPNAEAEGEREPVGVIAVLTDTNGDGIYDKRTVFLDKLVMPRAMSLVGDGLLVGEPTRLWFCRDTNGDGACDEKTEVAADFGNTTNPEHNSNGLVWAMDNWIYSADWTARLRYEGGGKFTRETTISRGQWGIAQDNFGRLFHNSNSDPLRYDAVPAHYLTRNAHFSATGANVQLVPATLRVWPGRVTAGINRGYNSLDESGKMNAVTAACGPVVYRGTLFPEEFRGDAFIAEPTGNLIKRIKLTEKDGTVRGANAYEGSEFMTSTDERFRPVSLYNGPDGALYVVDFYRGIIQHRIYMTSFLRKQVEERGLDKGIAKGRIWRIVPDGAPKGKFQLGLARASSADLVRELSSPNGWVRDTAQRLLVERRDPAAGSALAKLATDASTPTLGRLHALWTLDGAGSLQPQTVVAALKDPVPQISAAAVRLAEKFLRAPSPNAEVAKQVLALVTSRTEPDVRLQLALSLGEARTPEADAALRALAVAAGPQTFIADAIVSGLSGREFQFVAPLVKDAAAAAASEAVRYAVSAIIKRSRSSMTRRPKRGRGAKCWRASGIFSRERKGAAASAAAVLLAVDAARAAGAAAAGVGRSRAAPRADPKRRWVAMPRVERERSAPADRAERREERAEPEAGVLADAAAKHAPLPAACRPSRKRSWPSPRSRTIRKRSLRPSCWRR